jgi:hypothetical protein
LIRPDGQTLIMGKSYMRTLYALEWAVTWAVTGTAFVTATTAHLADPQEAVALVPTSRAAEARMPWSNVKVMSEKKTSAEVGQPAPASRRAHT